MDQMLSSVPPLSEAMSFAIVGFVVFILTALVAFVIAKRKIGKLNAILNKPRGLYGLEHERITSLLDIIEFGTVGRGNAMLRLAGLLRRAINDTPMTLATLAKYEQAGFIESSVSEKVAEDVEDASVSSDVPFGAELTPEVNEIITLNREREELRKEGRTVKVKRGDKDEDIPVMDLNKDDVFNYDGTVYRVTSKSGAFMDIVLEAPKENIEAEFTKDEFIAWCRSVLSPKGLHKETENHLNALFESKGMDLANDKRMSGRSTAINLYDAFRGRTTNEFSEKAIEKGLKFPGRNLT